MQQEKNLTREALQQELWDMLPDNCRRSLEPLKGTYIESLMADIDSYCAGQHPGSIGWVKATIGLPQSNESMFVKIEGKKSVASWNPFHQMFVDDAGDFHPADQVEWYDESNEQPEQKGAVDIDELWDEHSALIGDDIDDLSFWSGRTVMKKEDFVKAIETYQQSKNK
jgi:hypothetical protein